MCQSPSPSPEPPCIVKIYLGRAEPSGVVPAGKWILGWKIPASLSEKTFCSLDLWIIGEAGCPRAVDSACTWGPHGSCTQCLGVCTGPWWGDRVRANGWTPPPREAQTLSGRGQSHAHDLKGSAMSLSQQLWDSWSTDLSTKSSWEKHSTQGQFCGPPVVLSMGNCGTFNPDGPQIVTFN